MNILQISRWLNQSRLSAAPCPWLRAVSIFVDESYENYDYDIIGPRARLRIAEVLQEHDFQQLSGRVFEGPLGRIEFPRPSRSLASDPSEEFEQVVDGSAEGVFATPTQILLTTWRREGPELAPSRQQDRKRKAEHHQIDRTPEPSFSPRWRGPIRARRDSLQRKGTPSRPVWPMGPAPARRQNCQRHA